MKGFDMSNGTRERALRRLERAKAEYMDALRCFRTEEEIRLAVAEEPEVNLGNVRIYTAYYCGVRRALMMMADEDSIFKRNFGKSKAESEVYRKAVFELITDDLRKTELFVSGADIGFCNHERDKKGKLKKCDAYFFEEYTLRKKIEE